MKCPECGNKLRRGETVCKFCRYELSDKERKKSGKPKKEKANKLGNCAIIFAFFLPFVGLALGIVAVCIAPKKNDYVLRKDGIKAIVMSIVVTAVLTLFFIVMLMIGAAATFIIPNL